MSTAKRRDTAAELALRRELHRRGLRFRVAYPVPGQRRRTVDVAFTRARVAVLVDGCFWHGCPEHGTKPRANSQWWTAKLAANHARDRDTDRLLGEHGWTVVRVWEHEAVSTAADRVEVAVRQATTRSSHAAEH
ncbi:very short patch repair endonuclease [Cellulomonas fimi]|uniref:very short patch repair endonuclease n=1 Tax=Cellulomonas fimi TaxID=1708 RepID=UPI002359188F|nr:very short patch repair endonuclease [Cellulomonas fimi]